MSIRNIGTVLFVELCLFTFTPHSFADDSIAIKDLPQPVLTTISKRYPAAELGEARKTLDGKAVIYDVELTNDKTLIEIAVYADGKIDWVAIDLPMDDLPKPVLAAVRKKYPASKLNHASTVYTVNNDKDKLEHYHVEITTKGGKKRGLDVLPKGMIEEDEPITD